MTKRNPKPLKKAAAKAPRRSLMASLADADADTFVCDDAFFDRLRKSSQEDYGAFLASDFYAALLARCKD